MTRSRLHKREDLKKGPPKEADAVLTDKKKPTHRGSEVDHSSPSSDLVLLGKGGGPIALEIVLGLRKTMSISSDGLRGGKTNLHHS